jgi:hypothetical protein
MKSTCSSDTSVKLQRTKRRYIPEDRILHNQRCEKLKSYNFPYNFTCSLPSRNINHCVRNACSINVAIWVEGIASYGKGS